MTMFSKKNRVELVGSLECPLTIGNAAFIKEAAGLRRTSTVQHFIQMPSGVIHIETKNTRYVLRPPAKASSVKEMRIKGNLDECVPSRSGRESIVHTIFYGRKD